MVGLGTWQDCVDFSARGSFRVGINRSSHWNEFCSRNAPQYGVPSRAILVARSLRRRQGGAQFASCRAMSSYLSRKSYELFTKCVTPNVTHVHLTISSCDKFRDVHLGKTFFEHFKIFSTL